MIILDVFSLLILTLLHFSQVGKPVLDSQLPIENTDMVPQLQQVASLCQSHPTQSKFF